MYYTSFNVPFCEIILVGDETGLTRLHMNVEDTNRPLEMDRAWERNNDFFAEARRQLVEYFNGERTEFDLKLNPEGTDFQKAVWKELSAIPFGEIRSYKDVAEAVGNPNASRAVGTANGKNPIPIIVPCHRVIGSNRQLTGFAFGLDAKRRLLELEGIPF